MKWMALKKIKLLPNVFKEEKQRNFSKERSFSDSINEGKEIHPLKILKVNFRQLLSSSCAFL